VGGARAGARLREMRRGECGRGRGSKRSWSAWAGVIDENSGDVRADWSTAGVGRAELTGEAHGTEREDGRAGATTQRLAKRVRKAEREEGRGGEETSADSLATWQPEREESVGQSGADGRGPPVRGGRRAGAGARGWA
jgi:hypothetical protein